MPGRTEYARYRDGRSDCLFNRPVPQPTFPPGFEIGRNRCEGFAVAGYGGRDLQLAQECDDLLAGYQSAAGQANIEHARYLRPVEGLREALQGRQLFSDICSADQGSNRAPAYNVGLNTGLGQGFDDADVRPTAGRATAQRKADA